MFQIAFTPSALDDIRWFRKHEQKTVFHNVEQLLMHQPNVETHNLKRLRPNQVAEWELRVGKYRVFYDANSEENVVEIKMVGYKEGNKLFVRGREYKL